MQRIVTVPQIDARKSGPGLDSVRSLVLGTVSSKSPDLIDNVAVIRYL